MRALNKPPQQRRRSATPLEWLREKALLIFAGLAVCYMLIPIAVITVFSFNDPAGKFNFTWQGFTLDHWTNAFGIPELTDALVLSLKLAAISTLISLVLLVGHLYLAVIHPSTRHALRGITRGEVREDWAERHHAKWVEAQRRSREQ